MSSFSSTDGQSKNSQAGLSETRSIDYIPERERHGHPFSQFTLWFGGNLQITAIVTGALAVVLGGDVVWSLIGLLLGQVLGAAVMSLHALQGPRLGLPQMIISRAQFGVFGAVVPLVLVCIMYVGFSASGTVLAGQPLRLKGEAIDHALTLWQPWAFAGEWPLRSEGIREPGLDFNIMTQRNRAAAEVRVVDDIQTPGDEGVAWVLQGRWQLGERQCEAHSGIFWHQQTPGELAPLTTDALLLLTTIVRR
ncbi:HutD family protein [Klebsiella aerogenes]|uniref:HutD family protein n=1 Tax=Klebsiella aerogenes TaxID=548 RepID=UPI0009D706E9|nr:HutD family protein [Klebsiella aerogenes]